MDVKRLWRCGVTGGGIVALMLGIGACQGDGADHQETPDEESSVTDEESADEEAADEDASVDGEQAADQVSRALEEEVGQKPDDVVCPDVPSDVGAVVRCELTAGPDTLGVTVTVTEVDGDRVGFDIEVDETFS